MSFGFFEKMVKLSKKVKNARLETYRTFILIGCVDRIDIGRLYGQNSCDNISFYFC